MKVHLQIRGAAELAAERSLHPCGLWSARRDLSGAPPAQASRRRVSFGLSICLCLCVSPLLPAQQASSIADAGSPHPSPPATPASYIISPDDELDVQVLDVPEASGRYRVGADGTLMLPLLPKPLAAQDLTLQQFEDEVAKSLQKAGMVSHPRVSVAVVASRVHSIAIGGAVKRPQVYPVFSKITLLDALSLAEGLADDAGDTAVIERGGSDSRLQDNESAYPGARDGVPATVQTISLKRLLEDGDASANVQLYPGDRVTVRRAGIVYVVGGVNRAGGFTLTGDRTELTVLEAVALAGDLKATAAGKKAVIIRTTPREHLEVPVNVEKILSGHAPDQPWMASDILFIPDSANKRALHRAGEAEAEAASLVVYRLP